MIGLSCYILADTFFIARRLGEPGLAALNLAISIFSFLHGIGLMIGMDGAKNTQCCKATDTPKKQTLYIPSHWNMEVLPRFFPANRTISDRPSGKTTGNGRTDAEMVGRLFADSAFVFALISIQ